MAPPAGLAQIKGAGGTFYQAVSATRTGAQRNQRQPVLTHPPNGGRAYLLADPKVCIPQAEPQSMPSVPTALELPVARD